ncbi:MAG: hypothetical protein IJ354_04810 [Clostridia bacterium]|nr:hypothetical protein [Clostridia bacterium]
MIVHISHGVLFAFLGCPAFQFIMHTYRPLGTLANFFSSRFGLGRPGLFDRLGAFFLILTDCFENPKQDKQSQQSIHWFHLLAGKQGSRRT